VPLFLASIFVSTAREPNEQQHNQHFRVDCQEYVKLEHTFSNKLWWCF
jgi:hypothetical protein